MSSQKTLQLPPNPFHGPGAVSTKVESNIQGSIVAALYKATGIPTGTNRFTYTAAILAAQKLLGEPDKDSLPTFVGKRVSGFFKSASVLSHHTKAGNLRLVNGKGEYGVYQVTDNGKRHFMGRVVGSRGQNVDHDMLPHFQQAIITGQHTSPKAAAILGKMVPLD